MQSTMCFYFLNNQSVQTDRGRFFDNNDGTLTAITLFTALL